MKAWKKRSKVFEYCYQKGKLNKEFIKKIEELDGIDVLTNWSQYCKDIYGNIEQEFSNE